MVKSAAKKNFIAPEGNAILGFVRTTKLNEINTIMQKLMMAMYDDIMT